MAQVQIHILRSIFSFIYVKYISRKTLVNYNLKNKRKIVGTIRLYNRYLLLFLYENERKKN